MSAKNTTTFCSVWAPQFVNTKRNEEKEIVLWIIKEGKCKTQRLQWLAKTKCDILDVICDWMYTNSLSIQAQFSIAHLNKLPNTHIIIFGFPHSSLSLTLSKNILFLHLPPVTNVGLSAFSTNVKKYLLIFITKNYKKEKRISPTSGKIPCSFQKIFRKNIYTT